jgi:hypothetical protein
MATLITQVLVSDWEIGTVGLFLSRASDSHSQVLAASTKIILSISTLICSLH